MIFDKVSKVVCFYNSPEGTNLEKAVEDNLVPNAGRS